MKNESIRLIPFDESDFDQLIAEIPDARFLLQWAGPKYLFPLDIGQLNDTLEKTAGEKPLFRVYKAVLTNTIEVIGHIQLLNVDYRAATCILGRVLIFSNYRGKGFGRELVNLAVKYAFENLGLREITLNVFDFNTKALALYENIGFIECEQKNGAQEFQNELWKSVKMKLTRDQWLIKERFKQFTDADAK